MLEDLVPDLDAAVYAALGEPVTPAAGAAFNGIFDLAPADQFDLARACQYTLRWLVSAATLAEGDELTIAGQRYRLAEPPALLSLHEAQARLTHLGAA